MFKRNMAAKVPSVTITNPSVTTSYRLGDEVHSSLLLATTISKNLY